MIYGTPASFAWKINCYGFTFDRVNLLYARYSRWILSPIFSVFHQFYLLSNYLLLFLWGFLDNPIPFWLAPIYDEYPRHLLETVDKKYNLKVKQYNSSEVLEDKKWIHYTWIYNKHVLFKVRPNWIHPPVECFLI